MRHRVEISLPLIAGTLCALVACAGQPRTTPSPPPASPASTASTASSSPAHPTDGAASASPASSVPLTAAPLAPVPAPSSTVATTKKDASWSRCHHGYKSTSKEVSIGVAALAKRCEDATKMKIVGKTSIGKQADQDKPQSFPLEAKAGHCYRVYAQAAESIRDLDVAVKDSAGVAVGEDSTDDPSPVVLEDGAVCFTKDDAASVVVSVGMGGGDYALQIWGD